MTNGFLYTNEEQRASEFAAAQYLFNKFPGLVKLSRKGWGKILVSLSSDDHALLKSLGFTSFTPPKHSYLKQEDMIIAFSRGKAGGLLGEGAFGRVKFAADKEGNLYAMKIEKESTDQSNESEIAQDVRLMRGAKTHRAPDTSTNKKDKYYSLFEYLGEPLDKQLAQNKLDFNQKISTARQIAWELHKLHTGLLSKSGQAYAHHDIKPANIVMNEYHRPKLIDYGLSEEVHLPNELCGSPAYLPMNKTELRKEDYRPVSLRLSRISAVEKDVFALKRSLYMHDLDERAGEYLFNKQELNQLPQNLQVMIDSMDSHKTLSRKTDIPLLIALEFAALEFGVNPQELKALSPAHQQQLMEHLESLDQLSDQFPDKSRDIDSLRQDLFSANNEEKLQLFSSELKQYQVSLQNKTNSQLPELIWNPDEKTVTLIFPNEAPQVRWVTLAERYLLNPIFRDLAKSEQGTLLPDNGVKLIIKSQERLDYIYNKMSKIDALILDFNTKKPEPVTEKISKEHRSSNSSPQAVHELDSSQKSSDELKQSVIETKQKLHEITRIAPDGPVDTKNSP